MVLRRWNPDAPLNQGLVAWYLAQPAYFGGSVWPDMSGSNPGTLTNMDPETDWLEDSHAGRFGALGLDGVDDRVASSPLQSVIAKPLTLSAWVKPAASMDSRVIMSVGNGSGSNRNVTYMYFRSSSSSRGISIAQFVNNVFTFSSVPHPIVEDEWVHIVSTADSNGAIAIYVDGNLIHSGVIGVASPPNMDTLSLGAFIDNNSSYILELKAAYSDVRVYDRVLLGSEVADYYAESLAGYPTTLLHHGVPLAVLTSGGL